MEKCDRCHRHFKPFYWFVKTVEDKLDLNKCYCYNYIHRPHEPTNLCKKNLQHCRDNNCHFLLHHEHNTISCGEYYDQIDIKSFLCKKCFTKKEINKKIKIK